MVNTKHCLVCKQARPVLYWHEEESGDIWCWCCSCGKSYSLWEYCKLSGISPKELGKSEFAFEKGTPGEVQRIGWPAHFYEITHPKATVGADFVKSRGIRLEGDMYYDADYNGIAFPLYFEGYFCGAQIRLIEPWKVKGSTKKIKMITIPGTKSSLLMYNWDQAPFNRPYRGIIITEGAFDCLAIEQSLNDQYGPFKNPWKVMAMNGSACSDHHLKTIKGLKDAGMTVVLAADYDKAGFKMMAEYKKADAITHIATTEEHKVDWNDKLKELGSKEFARFFIKRIAKI